MFEYVILQILKQALPTIRHLTAIKIKLHQDKLSPNALSNKIRPFGVRWI